MSEFILSNWKGRATHQSVQGTEQKSDFRIKDLVFDIPNFNIFVLKVLFKAAIFVYLSPHTGATALRLRE